MKSLLVFSLSLAVLVGCAEKTTERIFQVAPEDNEKVTAESAKLRAEKLVASAEGLLSPISFFYADEILDQALKADPLNSKAQFTSS